MANALATGIALLVATPLAASELLAPAFIDFQAGSAVLNRPVRAQILAALKATGRYRNDTGAYLCALGPPETPQVRAARVDAVRRMLRRYQIAKIYDEPEKCATMRQGHKPGVLITWWPQWR
jgi:hypothetical protein